ncbi:MAG: 7-cyano-7-deazaguanine synthase [Gemmataceae bacterium]
MNAPLKEPLAVLVSGGLDSAVLLGTAAREHTTVHPIFIRSGLVWEDVERAYLDQFLAAIRTQSLAPLTTLELPVRDLYGDHWSTTGRNTPDAEAGDEQFFLPGRNVVLLAKALLWCHLHKVPSVAMAVLAANPFPDATAEFFTTFATAVNRAVGGSVRIETPFAALTKADVVALGRDLPLEHTFSCANPHAGLHCGRCGKCGERGRAFAVAQVPDPTQYASDEWRSKTQRPTNRGAWE